MVCESPNASSRDALIALIGARSAQISALVAGNTALKARIGEMERRRLTADPQSRAKSLRPP